MLQRLGKLTGSLINIGIAAGLLFAPAAGSAPAFGAADGKPIGGIQCERQEYGDFHIHAHLDIFVDGQAVTVPPLIGIIPAEQCLYWMHTHDATGIIHIEAPKKRAFTLAQFFSIWKATREGMPARKDAPKTYINGKKSSQPPDKVELGSLMEIVLVYGKEPPSIPSSYQFPMGS